MTTPSTATSPDVAATEVLRQWHPIAVVATRLVFLAVATCVAFWNSFDQYAHLVAGDPLSSYLPLIPVAALACAYGTTIRKPKELPINDRQIDAIVGGVLIVGAFLVKAILVGRFEDVYYLTSPSAPAVWLFAIAGSVLMFGLRPTARYRWMWLLVLLMLPLPHRIVLIALGGSALAAGVITSIYAGYAIGVGAARTRRDGLVYGVVTAAAGVVLAVCMWAAGVSDGRALTLAPGIIAGTAVGCWILWRRRGLSAREYRDHGFDDPVVRGPRKAAAFVAVMAVVTAFVGIANPPTLPAAHVPGLATGESLRVPAGWRQVGATHRYGWVSALFGSGSVMQRQRILADVPNISWDDKNRRRSVMIDTVTTDYILPLDIYPVTSLYDLNKARFSDPQSADLGHGVDAQIRSVVDEAKFLTFTIMTWRWRSGDRWQEIRLLSVDNHEPDAPFPVPTLSIGRNLALLVNTLVRGNSVTADRRPLFKDRDMLVDVGHDIVDAQIQAGKSQ